MAEQGFWSHAQRNPSKLALVDPEGREWTRGEAVAVALPNCGEFYAIYLACLQSGFYLTPINWHLAGPEIAYIVADSGAKAFIGHERIAQVCRTAAEEIDFPKDARFSIG